MADIIASLVPGQYTGGQTLTVQFPAGTRKAIVTRTDTAPVLSEILASDTGPITPIPAGLPAGPDISRPFLAVTQDGRGNVIYDGGFPKFYNSHIANVNGAAWPAQRPTTLAGLPPACKYLLNALSFIANPRKVASGNRKILFLNNTMRGDVYNILASHYNPSTPQYDPVGSSGFRDIFDSVCDIGSWIPTYYDCTSGGGGPLEVTLSYLEQFVAVVYLASNGASSPTTSTISEATASNLAQFRTAGNGLAIITDHCGDNYTSVNDAIARGSVFGHDATKVAKYFGTYFSGNVDRNPVQVGEIRRQIGLPGPPEDHPLLAGMTDSEYIFAGGSESLVMPELYTANIVPEDQNYVAPMTTAGTYYVNVLVQLDDGTIITKPMRFIIINPSDIIMVDSFNRTLGTTTNTYKKAFDYSLNNTSLVNETYNGEIRVNSIINGYFLYENEAISYLPFSGTLGIPVKNNDVVSFYITQPYEYEVRTTISLASGTAVFGKSGQISEFIKALRSIPDYTGRTDAEAIADAQRTGNNFFSAPSMRNKILTKDWWRTMYHARLPFGTGNLAPCNLWVSATPATWATTKPAVVNIGSAAIIASTNDVYYYSNKTLDWALHPQKANVLFNFGRAVINTADGAYWTIGTGTTVKD